MTQTVKIQPKLSSLIQEGNSVSNVIDYQSLKVLGSIKKKRVWIYNVSSITHRVDHPVVKVTTIPAKEPGKEYVLVASLPEIMALPIEHPETGQTTFVLEDGKRVAMDFINPENLGLDQNQEIKVPLSTGRNLSNSGVFWSMRNPPLKSEVAAAKKRMERYYEWLSQRVEMLARMNPLLKEVSPEHEEAVKYLKCKTTQEMTQNVRK